MKRLIAIGEALIDFVPNQKGEKLKDVNSFSRVVGGAPTNVAGVYALLGGEASVITQVGNDAFGDHILEVLENVNVDTGFVNRTDEYETSLAFVSLQEDGNRDFKFYRKAAADLQLQKSNIKKDMLLDAGVVHFCSVDLVESPMKDSHIALLDLAQQAQVPISFDPNLRLSLWSDHDALKKTVHEFLPYATMLKLSDDEISFLFHVDTIEECIDDIFKHRNIEFVIYTMGANGATLLTREEAYHIAGYKVEVKDTTGAGDAFIGSFLFAYIGEYHKDIESCIDFANAYAAYSTTKIGALGAMPTLDEVIEFQKAYQ